MNSADKITNILFVCTGNICRSPFAEGLFKRLAGEKNLSGVSAQSAGLFALSGNEATFPAQQVAVEHGVDLTGHRAQPVTPDLAAQSDLVLVMEKHHQNDFCAEFPGASQRVRLLRNFARYGSPERGIADPYGLNYDAYRFCFLDIEDAVLGLVDFLSEASGVPGPNPGKH